MYGKIPKVYESVYGKQSVKRKPRSFPNYKICITTEGYGVWMINNCQVSVSKGDVFFLNNTDLRTFIHIKEPLKMIICELEPLFIDKMFLPLFKNRPTELPRSFSIKNMPRFEQHMKEALREKNEKRDYSEYCIAQSVNLALTEALRRFSKSSEVYVKEVRGEVLSVLGYIENHLCEDFSLELLAIKNNMSASALCKQFSKSVGMGFSKYVAQKRIERVIDIIRDDKSVNILDAAFSAGFKNSAAFYDAFKRITGTTPKEIRKNRYYPL